ncbi:alpha/beta-hydrolase [Lentithecium fluviatile CBS 122367]|uniref:Alpha/beta-hydrolase n=1 Tax=Lentithecium fluviatile CBS 122367 TaxID=1168545 RepID=A0A6G1JF02_9PLEO|nr:alpha/beta-hydrolase [Lentithecium fluviatile CBS 122367]
MFIPICGVAFVLCFWVVLCDTSQYGRVMVPLGHRQELEHAPLSFSGSWKVLGPFQIGTREATWGADPLEYVGGFRALQYDPDALFRSSLPTNGMARWNTTQATQTSTSPTYANASLSISYSNVDWDFLKVVYGWAAVQYQAWARGELTVRGNSTQSVILSTDAILEFWVDEAHYFGGDFFTFRKAPAVLHLNPGTHKIDIRLVRDVRAFGGILPPTIDVVVHAERATSILELAMPGILMSDVVDGKLAAPVGSVMLRNSGENDIKIMGIEPSDVRHPISLPELDSQEILAQGSRVLTAAQRNESSSSENDLGIVIAAGQTRPVAFDISLPTRNVSSVEYVLTYKTADGNDLSSLHVWQNLTKTSIYEPHKITYLHPGGMASYAMLRPPARNATCGSGQKPSLPVLFGLHGAGLEADNGMVAHALDSVPDLCAWVMFPTGVTPWSGDDWHNWGFADVEAAVNSIPNWINQVDWKGPGVNVNRWIVSGHSNGGQGTWYALTHRPDKILAAAPLSGYASIQKYVPYELWQPADPRRTAVISASLNSYRHEMLMPNARGIPVQQQHGEMDDNVPAYNSRLLAQQLFLSGTDSSYNEVPGQNHWWDTVMTTPELVDFYYTQTKSNETIPRKLDEFELVVGDPGDMGSKGGIKVLLLEDPGQYGRVHAKGHTITTSNVLSLEFDPIIFQSQVLSIDDSSVILGHGLRKREHTGSVTFSKSEGKWSPGPLATAEAGIPYRQGRQLGSMTAILRTQGPFVIRHKGSNITSHLALQVSRNLHQYFQADAHIASSTSWDGTTGGTGNVITLAMGEALAPSIHPDFPIQASSTGITVRDSKGAQHHYNSDDTSLGAAFLRPLEDERLELVLWGSDADGLSQAARLVPMVTGVGQPDFVLLGEKAKWEGVDGALALGSFDYEWKVTPSSVVS